MVLAKQNSPIRLPDLQIEDLGESPLLLGCITQNPGMIQAGSAVLFLAGVAAGGWPAGLMVVLAAVNDSRYAARMQSMRPPEASEQTVEARVAPVDAGPASDAVERAATTRPGPVETAPCMSDDHPSTLVEMKPRGRSFEDDPNFQGRGIENPFAPKSSAQNLYLGSPSATAHPPVSDVDHGPLPTHKELEEMAQCNKACIPYQEFCVMADAMVRMGAPRPTPASLAVTLHYTQRPMDKGVGGVVGQLEPPVGETVGMTLKPSVVEPLAKPDPKEQVISVVDKFLSAGNKLDIERVDIEGSNELKVIRKAAQVGLSLHWLTLKFKINKNTKAYNSLEVCFTQNGGKVNR